MDIALTLIGLVIATIPTWLITRRSWQKKQPKGPIAQLEFIGLTLFGWSLACLIASGIVAGLAHRTIYQPYGLAFANIMGLGMIMIVVTIVTNWILDARDSRQEQTESGVPARPRFGWGGLIFLVAGALILWAGSALFLLVYGSSFLAVASTMNDPSFSADREKAGLYSLLTAQAIGFGVYIALITGYKIIKWHRSTRNWDAAMAARNPTPPAMQPQPGSQNPFDPPEDQGL
jgi:hypothetical protein